MVRLPWRKRREISLSELGARPYYFQQSERTHQQDKSFHEQDLEQSDVEDLQWEAIWADEAISSKTLFGARLELCSVCAGPKANTRSRLLRPLPDLLECVKCELCSFISNFVRTATEEEDLQQMLDDKYFTFFVPLYLEMSYELGCWMLDFIPKRLEHLIPPTSTASIQRLREENLVEVDQATAHHMRGNSYPDFGLLPPPCVLRRGYMPIDRTLVMTILRNNPQDVLRVMEEREVVGGELDCDLITSWMLDCEHNHPCLTSGKSVDAIAGLLLVDVRTRLIIPAPDNARYLCLSYVWGNVDRGTIAGPVLTSDGQLQLPPSVPRTIEDAIKLTANIHEQYLWVDLYCIHQSDAVQRAQQINQMHKIFGSSILTIVNLAGPSSHHGIAGMTPRGTFLQFFASKTTRIGFAATRVLDRRQLMENSVWSTRGWTFQEELLSSRLLFIAQEHYWLQCQDHEYTHTHPGPLQHAESNSTTDMRLMWPRTLKIGYSRKRNQDFVLRMYGSYWTQHQYKWTTVLHSFSEIVSHYNRRQFTDDSDLEDAFTGIAQALRATSGIRSKFGLPWVWNLVTALCWSPRPPLRYQQDLPLQALTKSRRRIQHPSWSWLGWRDIDVSWDDVLYQSRRSHDQRWYTDVTSGKWMKVPPRGKDSFVPLMQCRPEFVEKMAFLTQKVGKELHLRTDVATLQFAVRQNQGNASSNAIPGQDGPMPSNLSATLYYRGQEFQYEKYRTRQWDAMEHLRQRHKVVRKQYFNYELELGKFEISSDEIARFQQVPNSNFQLASEEGTTTGQESQTRNILSRPVQDTDAHEAAVRGREDRGSRPPSADQDKDKVVYQGEFVMLQSIRSMGPQQWDYSGSSVEIHVGDHLFDPENKDFPIMHEFATVWALLVAQGNQGKAERVALVKVPLLAWYEARPITKDISLI